MSRFYVKPEDIKKSEIHVGGNEAHHIVDVMRLEKGDGVVAFDGLGNEYTGIINEAKKKLVIISIKSRQKQSPLNTKITLAQSIPKSDKMDYIIQKTTELGIHSIIPIITERTVVKIDKNKKAKKMARWAKIAREASKQCGRSIVPEIKDILNFREVINSGQNYSLRLIPSLIGEKKELKSLLSKKIESTIILIGPEGGFSPSEVKLAQDSGFSAISLGVYTLKSDTAAITSAAILSYALNLYKSR